MAKENIVGFNDLISVIVPVYNIEVYLPECIESICHQTYDKLEIILINDGSNDKSKEICEEFQKKDDRIILINKENGGQSSARNTGIDNCSGKYIMFVDGDDIIDEHIIERLYKISVDNNADISMCDRQRFTEHPINPVVGTRCKLYSNKSFMQLIYKAPKYIAVWGKLYKKDLFDEFRFKENIIYEDEDATPQIIHKANRIAYCDDQLYFYRCRENSIMTSNFSLKNLDIIYVCEHRIELFQQWGYKKLHRKAVIDYYIHLNELKNKLIGRNDMTNASDLVDSKLECWNKYGVKINLCDRILYNIR